MLRHRHDHLPPLTKERYRELAASRLGIALPSDGEEEDDPVKADLACVAAADALRPLTNDRRAFADALADAQATTRHDAKLLVRKNREAVGNVLKEMPSLFQEVLARVLL